MSQETGRGRSRATLTDVARLAGVSATTVSLVLAGKADKRRISEETDQRVRTAAETLGYTPNLLHRSLRRGKTGVISFYNAFRQRDESDLYMDRMSSAVEHAGGKLGYDVLVHCNFQRDPRDLYESLNGGFADGLLFFAPLPDDPLLPMLRASNLPTVLIHRHDEEGVLASVRDDEDQGMRLLADALVAHGHRRIAAIAREASGASDASLRLSLLRKHLAAHGVEIPDHRVAFWRGDAAQALDEVLTQAPEATALFVWHDRAAYRVLEECHARGLSVPEDLSLVGYDGLMWPSTSSGVIGSVHVDLADIARTAFQMLHNLITGVPGPHQTTLPVSFEPGTTLGPPRS